MLHLMPGQLASHSAAQSAGSGKIGPHMVKCPANSASTEIFLPLSASAAAASTDSTPSPSPMAISTKSSPANPASSSVAVAGAAVPFTL